MMMRESGDFIIESKNIGLMSELGWLHAESFQQNYIPLTCEMTIIIVNLVICCRSSYFDGIDFAILF